MDPAYPLSTVTVTIENHWFGPNFVNGLALNTAEYKIKSDTKAVLTFKGGFDAGVTFKQTLTGTGFGVDPVTGRMTGIVTSWTAFEKMRIWKMITKLTVKNNA